MRLTVSKAVLTRDLSSFLDKMDPYVKVILTNKKKKKVEFVTKTADDQKTNPEWKETFTLELNEANMNLAFQIYDDNVLKDTIVCSGWLTGNDFVKRGQNQVQVSLQ